MILKVFPEIAQVLPQALLALGKAVGELLQFLLPVGSFLSGIQHSLGQVLSKIVGGVLDFGSQLVQLREAAVELGDGTDRGGQVHRHDSGQKGQQRPAKSPWYQPDDQ